LKEIDRKFEAAVDSLVQSYDHHMKKIIPKPKLLPIRINIWCESKGIRIENVHVNPYDNLNDLKKIVEEKAIKRGDPVLKWGEGIKFILQGPLYGEEIDAAKL